MSTRISTTIPNERMGVLIGRDGTTKSEIENAFKVKLLVQSESGVIEIVRAKIQMIQPQSYGRVT